MSNVERLNIEQDAVDLLLNKFQRHRGDTLNSGAFLRSEGLVLAWTDPVN